MPTNRPIECESGWKELYQPIIDLCELYGVTVLQIKEKFGGLRIYVRGDRSGELGKIISAAEEASFHTCEECGEDRKDWDFDANKRKNRATPRTSRTSRWVRTLCDPCREKWDEQREAGGYTETNQ